MSYIVTGPLAVAIVGGKRRYLSHNAQVPEGADADRLAHLVEVGLVRHVAEASDPEPEPAASDTQSEGGADLDALTLDQLRALATERGVDLGGATRKDDIRAAIATAGN